MCLVVRSNDKICGKPHIFDSTFEVFLKILQIIKELHIDYTKY